MRATALLVVVLALAGCKRSSPSTMKGEGDYEPTPADAVKPNPGNGGVPVDGPPWSEGTANKKLVGMTDEEIERLLGKPDEISPSPDGQFTDWYYREKKWLKPAPGAAMATPSGVIISLKSGKVRRLQRIPN